MTNFQNRAGFNFSEIAAASFNAAAKSGNSGSIVVDATTPVPDIVTDVAEVKKANPEERLIPVNEVSPTIRLHEQAGPALPARSDLVIAQAKQEVEQAIVASKTPVSEYMPTSRSRKLVSFFDKNSSTPEQAEKSREIVQVACQMHSEGRSDYLALVRVAEHLELSASHALAIVDIAKETGSTTHSLSRSLINLALARQNEQDKLEAFKCLPYEVQEREIDALSSLVSLQREFNSINEAGLSLTQLVKVYEKIGSIDEVANFLGEIEDRNLLNESRYLGQLIREFLEADLAVAGFSYLTFLDEVEARIEAREEAYKNSNPSGKYDRKIG